MAPPAPSLRENAPASSSSHTSRNPSAPPKSVAASAFFLRLTPYPLRLWIGEFFRGSLALPLGPNEQMGPVRRQGSIAPPVLRVFHLVSKAGQDAFRCLRSAASLELLYCRALPGRAPRALALATVSPQFRDVRRPCERWSERIPLRRRE